MHFSLKKIIYSISAIIIFMSLVFFLNWTVSPHTGVLQTGWKVIHDGITEEIELPFKRDVHTNSSWTYVIEFEDPGLEDPALILTRVLSYALEIKLNGKVIWKVSEIENPTANIWNYSLMLPIYADISGKNTLTIITAPLHISGFSTLPYFLEYSEALKKTFSINFLLNDMLLISIGGSLIIGLLLISLAVTRKTKREAALYMGIASVTAAIYCLDYQYRISGGSVDMFFIFKKLILLCGYISAGSFLVAISIYTNKKDSFIKPVIALTILSCIGIAISWNFPVLYTVFKFSNVILLINLLLGVYMLTSVVTDRESFLYPMWLLVLSITQVIVSIIRQTSEPLTLQYILLISTIFFSIHILLDFNSIFKENKKLAIGVFQDPLTGVFNRRYLKKMKPQQWKYVAMTDLDNFKYYNDTYGHAKGDLALKLFVEIVENNLRTDDLLMRFGGDEFLIFLAEVDGSQSDMILCRISEQFSDEIDDKKVGISYGLKTLDRDIDYAIAEADMNMYEMKNSRKTDLLK